MDLVYIEGLDEDEGVEQQSVEERIAQKDAKEEEVLEAWVHPLIEVQQNVMEIDMTVPKAIEARRQTTIMDRTTLLDKGIHILDLDRFMWI